MLKDIIRGVLGKEDKPEWMRPGAMVARISAIAELEFGKVVSSEDGGFYESRRKQGGRTKLAEGGHCHR